MVADQTAHRVTFGHNKFYFNVVEIATTHRMAGFREYHRVIKERTQCLRSLHNHVDTNMCIVGRD